MAIDKTLKTVGLGMIVVSAFILFSAVPLAQQSVVSFGPFKAEGISEVSATRITIGVIGIILGLTVLYGKKGLKLIMG